MAVVSKFRCLCAMLMMSRIGTSRRFVGTDSVADGRIADIPRSAAVPRSDVNDTLKGHWGLSRLSAAMAVMLWLQELLLRRLNTLCNPSNLWWPGCEVHHGAVAEWDTMIVF